MKIDNRIDALNSVHEMHPGANEELSNVLADGLLMAHLEGIDQGRSALRSSNPSAELMKRREFILTQIAGPTDGLTIKGN